MESRDVLGELLKEHVPSDPVLFDLSKKSDLEEVQRLKNHGALHFASDDYVEQLRELFAIHNPGLVYTPDFKSLFQTYLDEQIATTPIEELGRWIYYPWRSQLVHILPEDDFYTVRTARNRNLITEEEQKKYYNSTVAIAGLSVGSAVAFALALQGGARHLRLADMDRLALTNTNRVLAGTDRLGELKVLSASRTIYELNPYAKIDIFPDGLDDSNIEVFFSDADIVIDEIDELSMKLRIREEARKRRIPVLMGADNGDNAIIDVERYDLDTEIEPFHGKLGQISVQDLRSLDKFGIGRTITKMLGPENITERMQSSLLEMGKSIVSWPQLGGAAMLNGLGIAYCVRKILINEPLETGRVLLSLDEKFDPTFTTAESIQRRDMISREFAKRLGI